jgi:hypothetical protein
VERGGGGGEGDVVARTMGESIIQNDEGQRRNSLRVDMTKKRQFLVVTFFSSFYVHAEEQPGRDVATTAIPADRDFKFLQFVRRVGNRAVFSLS